MNEKNDVDRWHGPLWLVQAALAAMFAAFGLSKLFGSIDALEQAFGWPVQFDARALRGIGALQLLAAVAVVVPAATRWKPSWSAVAAFAMGLWMILELVLFVTESRIGLAIGAGLVAAAAFTVSWARTWRAPIVPRPTGRHRAHVNAAGRV